MKREREKVLAPIGLVAVPGRYGSYRRGALAVAPAQAQRMEPPIFRDPRPIAPPPSALDAVDRAFWKRLAEARKKAAKC